MNRTSLLIAIATTLMIAATACSGPSASGSGGAGAGATIRAEADPAQLEAERRSFELINAERAAQGVPPLVYDPELADIARAHSRDMLESDFFEHDSPNTGSLEDRLVRADYTFREARENIAQHIDVEDAHGSLMDSPGHRANILASTVNHVGIGVVPDGLSVVVTQVFADRVTTPAATDVIALLTTQIEQERERAGLDSMRRSDALDATAVKAAEGIVAGSSLREAVDVAFAGVEPGSFGAIDTSVQRLLDASGFELPAEALKPDAKAWGAHATTFNGEDGMARVLLVIMVGT